MTTENPVPMQHFTVKPDGFNEVRKRAVGMMVVVIIFIVLITVLVRYPNAEVAGSADTFPYVLTAVVVIFSISAWNAMRRQRKIFESFRLTVGDETLVREQLYTTTITIEKRHVSKIVRFSTGQFLIDGGSKLNSIMIPSQIGNAEELGQILSEIKPISEKTAKPWTQYVTVIFALVGMVLMFAGLTEENRIISTFCGATLCVVMLYGFIVIQKNKNVDKRLKRISYIFLIPFVSILSVTIIKLIS